MYKLSLHLLCLVTWTETPKLLPSSILGIRKVTHILSKFAASTNSTIFGLIWVIISATIELQGETPLGRRTTFDPETWEKSSPVSSGICEGAGVVGNNGIDR